METTCKSRPICQKCHYRRNMSGTNGFACHWSIDNDGLRPFTPTEFYCEGFKEKEKYTPKVKHFRTDEEKAAAKEEYKKITECERMAKMLTGWCRAQVVKK